MNPCGIVGPAQRGGRGGVGCGSGGGWRQREGGGGAFRLQRMYVCVVVNIYVLFVKNKNLEVGLKLFFIQSQIVWSVKWCSSWDSYRSEHPGFSESARLGKI